MYRQLNHPTDLYFEVEGKSLDEIFSYSALAILEYIGEYDPESLLKKEVLEFEGEIEDILINYLNEILFRVLVREEYLVKVEVIKKDNFLNNKPLKISIICSFKRKKSLNREIKAVSFHMAKLDVSENKLTFRFIADV